MATGVGTWASHTIHRKTCTYFPMMHMLLGMTSLARRRQRGSSGRGSNGMQRRWASWVRRRCGLRRMRWWRGAWVAVSIRRVAWVPRMRRWWSVPMRRRGSVRRGVSVSPRRRVRVRRRLVVVAVVGIVVVRVRVRLMLDGRAWCGIGSTFGHLRVHLHSCANRGCVRHHARSSLFHCWLSRRSIGMLPLFRRTWRHR